MKIKFMLLSVPAIFGMLLLQSCKPKGDGCEEHDSVKTNYTISAADKSKIPFTGTDTLVYISNKGDTAILYGQGKNAFTEEVSEKWGPDPKCTYYNYIEHIEYTYKGNNSDLNNIFLEFIADIYSPAQTNAYFLINSKTYHGNLAYVSNELNYHDTLTLPDNKTYYGIGTGIFYNYHYGILRVITTQNTWLLLIP